MNDFKTMHLFAGHGGGLLADLILGHTPIVAVEWDSYACQVLRERAAEGWFPRLQVWEGDVRLFDPSEYAGSVDCIHAGFPCQDISIAGKQAGVSQGTRSGLYREVLRIVGMVNEIRGKQGKKPVSIFLENVSAILSNGLGTVLGDLAALGYDTKWLCIRASDVGAPHHRDRWFALADSNLPSGSHVSGNQCITAQQHEPSKCSSLFSYADGERLEGSHKQSSGERIRHGFTGLCETEFRGYWATEPIMGRVANGIPNRVHRLKGLGNAQVPLQAAAAWKLLGGV